MNKEIKIKILENLIAKQRVECQLHDFGSLVWSMYNRRIGRNLKKLAKLRGEK